MDDSPLNQAHREQRRAESFQRGGRLEEAAECHERAAGLLKVALTLTKNILAYQSIILQHDHHLRQHHLLRFRNKHLQKYLKAMEQHRMKAGNVSGSSGSGSGSVAGSGSGSGTGSRELAAFLPSSYGRKAQTISMEMAKYLEKFDSILDQLNVKRNEMKDQHNKTNLYNESLEVECSIEKLDATLKDAKDLAAIVEDLRSLQDNQTDLITQVLAEFSSAEKENVFLKAQVRELQARCEGYEQERRRLRAMADSSCSPFVFSPLNEFSPDHPSIPDLAPLEMPPLDFLNSQEDS